jgi:hypothetical protein
VLRPLADPEPPCRLGRLAVASGADGFAWAALTGRDGSEWGRWEGHAAVAELVRRVLPAATVPSAGETVTWSLSATIVAVAVFVTVALDDAAGAPLLFLPDDFRRLGVEPRPGERWRLAVAVDLDGPTIRATRLIGVAAP